MSDASGHGSPVNGEWRRRLRRLPVLLGFMAWSCGGSESGPSDPPVPTSLQLSATTVSLRMGETSQFTATVLDQLGRTMTGQAIAWTSSDTTKMTVTVAGLARGVRPGTATLTASSGALTRPAIGTVLAPQLVVESAATVTLPIGAAGGTMNVQAANGTRYTLTVPATALLESVAVTMTAITSIQNLPTGTKLVAAVQLRPDGLTFLSPVTLAMDLPSVASATNLVGLRFADDGSALSMVPITRAGSRLTLTLPHFSGAGAANTTNPPLIPLTGGGTIADDAMNALMVAELTAQAPGGNYDIAAITAIFRNWYTAAVKPGLQDGATDESSLGASIGAWATWRDMIVTFQPTIAGALDAALSAEQAEGRAFAATALQAGIQRNNATCTAQQDLTAARKALGWQAVAEQQALATSANALDRTTVLNGLCVKVVYGQVTMPDPLPVLQPATLRVQAGIQFGPNAPVYLTNPTVDVRMTATGSTDGAAHHYQTDAAGFVEATLTPSGGAPVVVAVHACINDPVGFGLTLLDVCQDMTVTRTVQAATITVTPPSASLAPGGTQQFTATVTGLGNTAVTWTATGGTVSTGGLFTAGSTPGQFTVTATSVANATVSATVQVTIIATSTVLTLELYQIVACAINSSFACTNDTKVASPGAQQFNQTASKTTTVACCTNSGTVQPGSFQVTAGPQAGDFTLQQSASMSTQNWAVVNADGRWTIEVANANVSWDFTGSCTVSVAATGQVIVNFMLVRQSGGSGADELVLPNACRRDTNNPANDRSANSVHQTGILTPGRYDLVVNSGGGGFQNQPAGQSSSVTQSFTLVIRR